MDVVPVGQEPSGSVGLARLHHVLALPGAYLAVGLHQLGRIEDVAAQGFVVVALRAAIQEREVVGGGEEGHTLLACPGKEVYGLRRKRIAQEAVQLLRPLDGHGQVEAEIVPPFAHQTVFLFIARAFVEVVAGTLAALYLLDEGVDDAFLVAGAYLLHLLVQPRGPPFGQGLDALGRRQMGGGLLQALELGIQVDEHVGLHLRVRLSRQEAEEQGEGADGQLLAGGQLEHCPPVVLRQEAQLPARFALSLRMGGQVLQQVLPEVAFVAASGGQFVQLGQFVTVELSQL